MMENYRAAVILVVEDDMTTFQLAEIMFRRANVTNKLYHAKSGIEALDFLYKRNGHENAPTPDLVYLDLHLPMLSGTEVLEKMYNDPELSKIPTMMLTGSESDTSMMVAREFGAVGYVMKPLDPDKIMETYTFNKKVKIRFVVENED